ncbi:universal stress protein [Paenibacillus sp. HJGM_3]|uniref:universal stress protein n=1 Tax=Paenibacillus sp. HJGM_3 TaxID=3379816 RepID=UPI00385FC4FF
MYNKILVPTDGSPHADRALIHARKLAKRMGTDTLLTILHVKTLIPIIEPLSGVEVFRLQEDEAQQIIQPAANALREDGIRHDWLSIPGDPAQTICSVARESGYELIVMGSRGLGRFSEVILGSVSHKVIQHAPCPVLIVK